MSNPLEFVTNPEFISLMEVLEHDHTPVSCIIDDEELIYSSIDLWNDSLLPLTAQQLLLTSPYFYTLRVTPDTKLGDMVESDLSNLSLTGYDLREMMIASYK